MIGILVGLALTRDTTTEVPSVTGNQLERRDHPARAGGFSVGEVIRVERDAPAERQCSSRTRPPRRRPTRPRRLRLPHLLLLEAGGDADGQRRARQRQGPLGRGRERGRGDAEAGSGRLRSRASNGSTPTRSKQGIVIRTEPGGGKTATKGSTVTLFVSRGPKLIKVPVLVGSQREECGAADPQPRPRSRASPKKKAPNRRAGLIQQSPDAGSKVEPGSTVAIVVSSGEEEETAKVPNVIGKERREAVEVIRAAGLTPSVEEEETEVPSQVGRVIDQFPPPGSRAGTGRDGDDHGRQARRRKRRRRGRRNEGRGPRRRPLLRARRLAALRRRGGAGAARGGARDDRGDDRPRGRLERRRRHGRAGPRRAGCSAPTRSSRPCTAPSARTAASRGCSSGSTSPTSAPTSSPRRSAWTS